jgi:hypothetical protein
MATILEEIAQKHLPYEVDMLRQTYRKLAEGPLPDAVVRNALIESFCIHARSLLDFFGNWRSKPDDYIAADFTNGFKPRINIPPAIRTKLNKEIFHLTGERKSTEADQFSMTIEGKKLIRELEREIVRFEYYLKAEFTPLFKCETLPLTAMDTFSFEGQANSTSVVSNMGFVGYTGPKRFP